MTWKKALMILAATALLAGCVSYTAAQSNEAKAWVADGHIFWTTDVLYCDATDGNPECWPVNETERGD